MASLATRVVILVGNIPVPTMDTALVTTVVMPMIPNLLRPVLMMGTADLVPPIAEPLAHQLVVVLEPAIITLESLRMDVATMIMHVSTMMV